MNSTYYCSIDQFMRGFTRRNPGEPEFHQAVHEVAQDIIPFLDEYPIYREYRILERLTEPDRVIIFRVGWEDEQGFIRANRGYRVQHSNAIGPYKGGIRFLKTLTLDTLKFLAFEQTFKNSLTGLPMGGAKGGSDFNPKGKSDHDVMHFCQAFMTELSRYIGQFTDVPAGDIGVGSREISYMFGQYKRMQNQFTGVMTGKGIAFGGSLIRTEATGYGVVYLLEKMLNRRDDSVKGKTVAISGSGNVAQFTAEKLIALGGKVITMSDSTGMIHDPSGLDEEKLAYIKELKNVHRGRIHLYAKKYGVEFYEARSPWRVPCDIAVPCATQNEISEADASTLVDNNCIAVCEGANMPTVQAGAEIFQKARILYAPSKAANAGGVAVSGLEMSQNSMRMAWTREDVDRRLREIMGNIHDQCEKFGQQGDHVDYRKGANIAGFVKVAEALVAQGVM